MTAVLVHLGRVSTQILTGFGDFSMFSARALGHSARSPWTRRGWRLLLEQAYVVGARSVPVLMVTGMFIGMVLAVQTTEQFAGAGLQDRLGVMINMSIVRELGPVLAGVMLAGRVGGALAAELGTMNVTEQIDALRSMGTDPIRYLVAPRFLACFLLTPLLTFYCDALGALGGWFIAVRIFEVPNESYWYYSAESIEFWDLFNGLVKSFVFGAAIALIACYKGFTCRPGAEGVGRACTESFVWSFVAILVLDFFIALSLKTVYEAIYGFKLVL